MLLRGPRICCSSQPLPFTFACCLLLWVVYSVILYFKPKIPTQPSKITSWSDCQRLIEADVALEGAPKITQFIHKMDTLALRSKRGLSILTDETIFEEYRHKTCPTVLKRTFPTPEPHKEELDFPIAYTLQIYRSAPLVEKLLQRIYMPHNMYCIHIDKKSPDALRRAIIEMIRCLPNVFVTTKDVDVIYFHISILQAQLNCMKDLLQSPIKWKYLINLVGQDVPLYNNFQIVQAMKGLNGLNNIESRDMPSKHLNRVEHVYQFQKVPQGLWHSSYSYKRLGRITPPPHNITIYKGSTLAALTRDFCVFIQHSELAKNLFNWLKQVLAPEECFYASLQRLPGVPGGYHGVLHQHDWIMRSIRWYYGPGYPGCYGRWVRDVCVLGFGDMRWIMGQDMRTNLFAQKVPFDFDDRFFDCVDLAVKERTYGTAVFE